MVSLLLICAAAMSQPGKEALLPANDLKYLEQLTRDVMDSSRILPGQVVAPGFGANKTGGTLIRPGGRSSYPSFWIRDYAMSLPSGFVTAEEQRHMLMLTASTQSDRNWITERGAMVPFGAIADHIRPDDGVPIYFPGTYDPTEQGDSSFGVFPPYCDQYFFVDMAYWFVKATGRISILDTVIKGRSLFDRLEISFKVPPVRYDGVLVYTTEELRGVDFGFRDVITITGDLLYPSLLKYKAALELADLSAMKKQKKQEDSYRAIVARLKKEIPLVFSDGSGLLHASTRRSRQADVWGTALAVQLGVLDGEYAQKAGQVMRDAYLKGELSRNGNIRHVLTSLDFDSTTSWEKSLAKKGTYQNGAYWGTPVGWVCRAITLVDLASARRLALEYLADLRKGDFRKGPAFGAPWECYNDYGPQNPVYMTSVACPFIVFKEQ